MMSESPRFRRTLVRIGQSLLFEGLLVLLFSLALILTSLIPVSSMERQLTRSSSELSDQGTYPILGPIGDVGSQVDNYTVAIMLGISGYGEGGIIDRSFMGYREAGVPGSDPVSALRAWSGSGYASRRPEAYPRYWHGWLVVLRPLLLAFDLSAIRLISLLVLVASVSVFLFLVYRAAGLGPCLACAIPVVLMRPIALAASLSFPFSFILGFIGASVILAMKLAGGPIHGFRLALFFLGIGALDNFFDFLCNPIVSLGIPLIGCVASEWGSEMTGHPRPPLKAVGTIAALSLCWATGYGLTWIAKWVITEILTDYDVIGDVISQAALRSGAVGGEGDAIAGSWRVGALLLNFYALIPIPLVPLIIPPLAYTAASAVRLIPYRHQLSGGDRWLLAALAVVALLAIAWYIAMPEHSHIHYRITYRDLFITLVAIGLLSVRLITVCSSNQRARSRHR